MRKLILTSGLAVGLFVFANATTVTKNENTNNKKENASEAADCTLTVECEDGTVVEATAKDCKTAGAMVDAGCAS